MEKELIAFEDVRQLAQKMHNAGLRELEWRGADWSVRLRYPSGKTMAEPPPLPPLAAETRPLSVCSPMPGRLLLSHPSHGEAFVSEGQHVAPNDILALVQVGPLYLPVRSPVAGTLKNLVAPAGSRLEYGSEIALLQPVQAGLFVGDDRGVWFLAGDDPSTARLVQLTALIGLLSLAPSLLVMATALTPGWRL